MDVYYLSMLTKVFQYILYMPHIVLSILIPSMITKEDAVDWVKSHGYIVRKIHTTAKYHRFRQHTTKYAKNKGYTSIRTIPIGNDGISMIVLTSAVVLPMIQKAGFDLIWFGIFIVLLVEIAEVTPPVGFNLFVLQNMTGKDSNTIARAALPFFGCLVVCIVLITLFPQIVTFLPNMVMGVDR